MTESCVEVRMHESRCPGGRIGVLVESYANQAGLVSAAMAGVRRQDMEQIKKYRSRLKGVFA